MYILDEPFPKGLCEYFVSDVSEILLNGNRSIELRFYDGSSQCQPLSQTIPPSALTRAIQEFSLNQGIRLDPLQPYAGGDYRSSEHGFLRWHAVIPPVSPEGSLFCLRRHRFELCELESFGNWHVHSESVLTAIEQRRPMFIVGPTACGKTTLLLTLLKKFAPHERVIFIERVAEIPLLFPSWIRLVGREKQRHGEGAVSIDHLLEESLRLRPDRLIISEVRGQEVDGLFQAMHAGHSGVMTTFHADSALSLLARLKTSGKAGAEDWELLFAQLRPIMIVMKREKPSCIEKVIQLGS